MKPYRIKHVPSGLYYKPGADSNLSRTGKIYPTNNNGVRSSYNGVVHISMRKSSPLIKKLGMYEWKEETYRYNQVYCKIPQSDFTKEEL